MAKKRRVYPEHSCISCERRHTNKTYCDIHERMYMGSGYVAPRPPVITADKHYFNPGRRRESSNQL